MRYRIGIISGGFDPLHKGHVEYIKAAKQSCNELIIGLNSDDWLTRKKGRPFMDFENRKAVLSGHNEEVWDFDDTDGSAFDLIRKVKTKREGMFGIGNSVRVELIFMNGGDRTKENIPEEIKCKEAGIECTFLFGVGGEEKQNSSSWILGEWESPTVKRAWGTYKVLHNKEGFRVKELKFDSHRALSDQRHSFRSEHWHVVRGSITMKLEYENGKRNIVFLEEGDSIDIPVGTWHKAINEGDTSATVIEVWLGEVLKEEDIERRD